jgi:DnaJ family protein C protein 13
MPEAMIHYLENYAPENFSQIFLGEFDTPEAIWNSEMRRQAIEKIAYHVADFSPRLRANTRAIYQYVPLPTIMYPNLEKELFCGLYYLRHLTNSERFPKWPIRDPVRLLKDTLNFWRDELNKEPNTLSNDDALRTLGLDPSNAPFEEPKIRRAYFKMAQKYHPDKNPEGKEMFQEVNKAYEHMASKKDEVVGPDPVNIRKVYDFFNLYLL